VSPERGAVLSVPSQAGERLSPPSVAAALQDATSRLADAGVADPRRDARLLLAAVLDVESGVLLGWPERRLDGDESARFQDFVRRRAEREPVARIRGSREFWSLPFQVTPATLDPRPDSETLIEAALADFPDLAAPLRVIDFGTGTGCLLLSFLAERRVARGIGVDRSPAALACAAANAAALSLADRASFVASDWGAALRGDADVILANPPYIESAAIAGLEPEVARYEPVGALDGGADGLDAYRKLAFETGRLLAPLGRAYFELGAGQAPSVARIMARAGLAIRGTRRDLAGVERCLLVERSA
jgi:release factor glutamine methyltransferase